MLENNRMIRVTNRDNGSVGYTIPDMGNLHRNFQSGESKEVTMEELRKLVWLPGGQYILENLLVIESIEAQQELLPSVEPEYNYTKTDYFKLYPGINHGKRYGYSKNQAEDRYRLSEGTERRLLLPLSGKRRPQSNQS